MSVLSPVAPVLAANVIARSFRAAEPEQMRVGLNNLIAQIVVLEPAAQLLAFELSGAGDGHTFLGTIYATDEDVEGAALAVLFAGAVRAAEPLQVDSQADTVLFSSLLTNVVALGQAGAGAGHTWMIATLNALAI